MTAKLVLYISIYFCAPLIPLEMSIYKSLHCPSHMSVSSLQTLLLYHNLFSCFQSTYVCYIARNLLWTNRPCWKWSHCIIYTACTCASKHDPFSAIAWTSQSMGQPKLYAETIHHTHKYCSDKAIWQWLSPWRHTSKPSSSMFHKHCTIFSWLKMVSKVLSFFASIKTC